MFEHIRTHLCLLLLLVFSGPGFAQTTLRSEEDILRRGTRSTWVDAQKQDVQFAASPLDRDNMDSKDAWKSTSNGKDFWSWLFGDWGSSTSSRTTTNAQGNPTLWRDFWSLVGNLLTFLVWCILIVAFGFVISWLLKNQQFYPVLLRRRSSEGSEDIDAQQAKYSDLPVDLEQGIVGLRAQAASLRNEGDYSRAVIYLFSYLLVELDSAHCITLARGKTNYRYLRELGHSSSMQAKLRRVVHLFEEAYFGRRTISPKQFENVWDELPAFEAEIKQATQQPIESSNQTSSDVNGTRLARLSVLLFCLAFGATGCKSQVSNSYGISESALAEQSPGGLSVFREMVKARKLDTETLVSLRPTLDQNVQTIVWTPDYFPQHTKPVLDRLDRWLRQGGKTLVYVGRDYSPHSEYWNRIANRSANPFDASERARYKIQSVKADNELDAKRSEYRELLVSPWFYWRYTPGEFRTVKKLTGDWASDLENSEWNFDLRSALVPINSEIRDSLIKELDWNTTPVVANPTVIPVPTGRPPPPQRKINIRLPSVVPAGTTQPSKVWNTDDEELLAIAKGVQPSDLSEPVILLADADGTPLISELQYKSSSSRVLILSNSSIVSNLGLLQKSNRKLANRIIDKFPIGRAGFLSMDSDPPIRQGSSQEEQKGFEMLTVWPLNVLTIHAAILAFIAMIAAFPIFGRPKTFRRKPQADFSEHVESLGELLRATDGRLFAKDAISKYFQVVRRDSKTAWTDRQTLDTSTNPNDPGRDL